MAQESLPGGLQGSAADNHLLGSATGTKPHQNQDTRTHALLKPPVKAGQGDAKAGRSL